MKKKTHAITFRKVPACSPHPEDSSTKPVMPAHVNPHIPKMKELSLDY